MKRTLAIGDIHGCLAPLEHLWKIIDPQPEDRIIFIGDYVDRGPDSKGVIDFVISLQPDFDITCLTGNHEEKFFLARIDHTELAHWLEAWGGGWLTCLHVETGEYWQTNFDGDHREGVI